MRGMKLIACAIVCALALASCKSVGPVVCPEPAKVVLPAMPDKPIPRAASTARRELLKPETTTPR